MLASHEQPKAWYDAAFGHLYPMLYGHRDDSAGAREAAAIVRLLGLAADPPIRVLDACCGTGRHVAPLARMGFEVCGIDRSAALLAHAAERPESGRRLARADLRALPFGSCFDVVLNLFTSFGYFEDEENAQALAEMARVLRPGGRLVIDHMNRARVERRLVASDRRSIGGAKVLQRRWIEGDRVRKAVEVAWPDGARSEALEDVRLYSAREMRALLEWAGLREARFYGSLTGAAYGAGSERMVVVARK